MEGVKPTYLNWVSIWKKWDMWFSILVWNIKDAVLAIG